MKEDDFFGISELEQEYSSHYSDFFLDAMFEFLDMPEIASGYQKFMNKGKQAISGHTRKSDSCERVRSEMRELDSRSLISQAHSHLTDFR